MGLKALLDVYMVRKVGDSGTFKSKLEQLVRIRSLSAAQLQQIESALEAGSAAAHRGFDPSSETVTFVLDVVSYCYIKIFLVLRCRTSLQVFRQEAGADNALHGTRHKTARR